LGASVALACASALGCKEPNPDFVEGDGSSTGSSSASTSTSATTTVTDATAADTSTSSDGGSPTSAVDDGSSGSATTGQGTEASTGGGGCEDIDGDNRTPPDATDLGEQNCDAGPDQLAAVLVDQSDEDWFTFHGNYVDDGTCGVEDPVLSLSVGDAGLTVCAWLACDVGTAAVLDCGAGMGVMSPMGQPGCCNVGGVDMTFNCTGESDESATVAAQVAAPDPVECVAYDLAWDFDA
jgi:hypothetical protein